MDDPAPEDAPNAVLDAEKYHPDGKVQEILVRFFAFVQYNLKLIHENQQNKGAGKRKN